MNELMVVLLCVGWIGAGALGGVLYGERQRVKILMNLVQTGRPGPTPEGRTIVPDTAELRIDKSAAQVEQEYAAATIEQGIDHLEALYISEGAEVPSRKDLKAQVKDMLGRSGTPEAGVHV